MLCVPQADQRAADPGGLGGGGAVGARLGEDAALAHARRQLHVLSSNRVCVLNLNIFLCTTILVFYVCKTTHCHSVLGP